MKSLPIRSLILPAVLLSAAVAPAATEYDCSVKTQKDSMPVQTVTSHIGKMIFFGRKSGIHSALDIARDRQTDELLILLMDIGVPKDKGGNEAGNKIIAEARTEYGTKRLQLRLPLQKLEVDCVGK
jgi:hypothetical protein